MSSYWSSCCLISRHVVLLVGMSPHWSSSLLIGGHILSLVVMSSHWLSCLLIGRHVFSLVSNVNVDQLELVLDVGDLVKGDGLLLLVKVPS